MAMLIWYCARCRKAVRSDPPRPWPDGCTCKTPVPRIQPTLVHGGSDS